MIRSWTRCCCGCTPRPRAGAAARSLAAGMDLDVEQCLVLLREKGETIRWQPVSPTLMARLAEHGRERHAPSDGQLLRYADGRPITYRRYDHLWARIGGQLPWVATQQVSHALDQAHDADVGGAELRLRRRPRLRGAQRHQRRRRGHHDLRAGQHA